MYAWLINKKYHVIKADLQKATRAIIRVAPSFSPELRQRLDKVTPNIIDKIVEKALDGDLAAAKIILDRTAPVPKQSSATVTVPDLGSESTTLAEKAGAILSSVASGNCPADVGAVLMQSVTALAK